jgi:C4-dicarboxylate transporter DctM subunit
MEVVLLFTMVIGFLLIGVPIAVSLGLSSVLFLLLFSDATLGSVAGTLFEAFEGHFTLLAIPFFILASSFMTTGGVARRIIRFSIALVGHLPGGLAIAGVAACMMFAALSGSSPATVVAIGTIVIAGMRQVGYSREFAAGVICNAGTLGILIPPSIVMVVYAAAVEVSVGRMFLAGVIPGLLAGFMLMITIYVIAKVKNLPKGEWAGLDEIAASMLDASFGLFLIFIILGGIYGGVFTPTEAAAVAAVYAFFAAVTIYRDMGPLKDTPWLEEDERDAFGLGLRIVVFAFIGFLMHLFASSPEADASYPRALGLMVGSGWVLVCLLTGWVLMAFPARRGVIATLIAVVLASGPVALALLAVVPPLSGGLTGMLGEVLPGGLVSPASFLLTLLMALLIAVFVALPPIIFTYSLGGAARDAVAVQAGFGGSLGGGLLRFLRGLLYSLGGFFLAFFHRDTKKTLFEAGKLTVTLLFVIAFALILKHVLTEQQVPQHIAGAMLNAGFGPVMFLVVVNIILLIGGQFMEPSGLLVIVAPLVFPIAIELGIDPIHLGIIMVVNMEIGMITPPVGLNLFVTSGVAGMPMMSVVRAALPFLMVLFVFLIMVTYIPWLSTFLPNTFMGPEIITK